MTIAIPSIEQCLTFIDQHEMLDNIRAHSFLVARVGEALLDGLKRTGKTPSLADKNLVIAGALLHDIAKTLCIKTGCHHARVGQQICIDLGYPQIGELVVEHVVLNNFTPELYKTGFFGAKELVYYADKRVRHDQVVSLASRLAYIIERYGNNDPEKEQFIRKNFTYTTQFEAYLFNFLDFTEDDLQTQIKVREF